jgi:acrylyl-CoA reductase (NADPH) / 3-hydroxypropionyl-CoA dehydratase / 3-hydroxypropionyl-CoA synthetase
VARRARPLGHELTDAALADNRRCGARAAGARLPDGQRHERSARRLLALPTRVRRGDLGELPPEPLDAEFPLFFIYTSGSTGKPKGVVHVHGGYVRRRAHHAVAFDAQPGDVIYVVADPGLDHRPELHDLRRAHDARHHGHRRGRAGVPERRALREHHRALRREIFKAGVTFLKTS